MPIYVTPLSPEITVPGDANDGNSSYDFSTQTSEESDANGLVRILNVPHGSVYQAKWGDGPWITIEVATSGMSQQITGLRTAQAP